MRARGNGSLLQFAAAGGETMLAAAGGQGMPLEVSKQSRILTGLCLSLSQPVLWQHQPTQLPLTPSPGTWL